MSETRRAHAGGCSRDRESERKEKQKKTALTVFPFPPRRSAVSSGFIGAKQANLLVFVDGPSPRGPPAAFSSSSGGASESSSQFDPEPDAFNWGRAALAAIDEWHAKGAGGAEPYSFEWSDDRKKAEGVL